MKKQTQSDSTTIQDISVNMESLVGSVINGETPDEGYLTATQLAEKFKIPERSMREILQKLSTANKVTKKYWRVKTGDGSVIRKTAHYKEA